MHDGVRPKSLKGLGHGRFADADSFEVHTRGDIVRTSAAQIVDNQYVIATLQQALSNMRSDESCSTRHKDSHAASTTPFSAIVPLVCGIDPIGRHGERRVDPREFTRTRPAASLPPPAHRPHRRSRRGSWRPAASRAVRSRRASSVHDVRMRRPSRHADEVRRPAAQGSRPQGGIWFWSIFCLGLVVMRMVPRPTTR